MPPVVVEIVTVPALMPTEDGSNFTRTLHDPPPASDEISLQSVPGPMSSWNCALSELTPEIAIGSVPSFVTVTSCTTVALSSMSCFPNDNGDGLRDHAVCVPSPPTPTVRFERPPVVVEIVPGPDFTPTESGSNFTRTLHDPPPASDEISLQSVPGPVSSWNCESSELTPETAIASVPSFVTVTSCTTVALSSMSCLPNDNGDG